MSQPMRSSNVKQSQRLKRANAPSYWNGSIRQMHHSIHDAIHKIENAPLGVTGSEFSLNDMRHWREHIEVSEKYRSEAETLRDKVHLLQVEASETSDQIKHLEKEVDDLRTQLDDVTHEKDWARNMLGPLYGYAGRKIKEPRTDYDVLSENQQ